VSTQPRVQVPGRTAERGERFFHGARRHLLPVLSGLGLLVGVVLLVRYPSDTVLGSALATVGVGGTAVVCALAYLRSNRLGMAASISSPAPAPPTASSAVCSQCSAPLPSLEWEDLFLGRFEDRARGAEATGSLRTMFTPTSAGDQLWVHWLPAEVGQLPAELIGPIASSANFSPELEDLTSALVPQAPASSRAEEYGSVPFEPESVPTTPGPAVELPTSFVLERSPSSSVPIDPLSGSFLPEQTGGERPSLATSEPPLWMRSILAEALNPIPPHLRDDARGRSAGGTPGPGPMESPGAGCPITLA
jgi:hypothetical protein